jgi:HD-GYP domain-containing protein (c-di-GMP phosphodiesterase class II)
MKKRVIAYVYGVALTAVGALYALHSIAPVVDPNKMFGVIVLAVVAAAIAFFSYRVRGSTTGAASFLPYLTAVVLYPTWATTLAIALGATVAELMKKKMPIQRLFNASQLALAAGLSSLLYVSIGGVSLQVDPTLRIGPHSAAVMAFFLVNTGAVAGVISLAENRPFWKTWYEGNAKGLVWDIASLPLVYAFARVYVDWGGWGIFVLSAMIIMARMGYQAFWGLEQTNEELLNLFVQTVEFRDPYTSGHSQRVKKFSLIIADILELPPKQIEQIGTAALLHDVGKIHEIFAPILSKPGRLTPEERAIMELHPIKSCELVEKISSLRERKIHIDVRHHHENWDGSGYPDGKKGRDIPLASRIIMFADTIDAMTTDRPYRKALGEADVKAELLKYRGIQFDPEICDRLISSPEFYRLFDKTDSGHVRSLTQKLEKLVRGKMKTPAVA